MTQDKMGRDMSDETIRLTGPGFDTGPVPMDMMRRALDDLRGGAPMRETEADRAVREGAYGIAADELRAFVERFERLAAEKQDIADQQKEVMAEAKGRGYDARVLRKVIALRKRRPEDVAEEEAILAMYRAALEMA